MRFVRTAENLFELPLGFTRVEYLESSGTQYIDLGVGVKSNTVFKATFSVDSTSTGASTFWKARVFEGDVLVRDMIPCIDPLGVACMYDLVGKKPYYNQGTGTFTAGRQIIPVEYLESTGTQWIDTGVGGDLTTELTCEAAIVQAGNASVTNIMGNNVTSSRAITINMSANVTNPSPSRIRFGDTDNTTDAGAINLNTFYKYSTNKNELTVRDSSGTVLNTYPLNATTAFTTNGNILIYKLGDTSTQYIGSIKVKSATIKNNGVLVRDFIPCKDENNVGFMFDKVSGTCYLNAGTGSFTYGDEVYSSKLRLIKDAKELPDGYKRVEYLESTGTQYINTGIKLDNNSSVELDYQLTQAVQNRKGLFGGLDTGGSKRFGALLSPSNNQLEGGYGSGNEFYQLGLPDTNRHVIKQEKNLLYFDSSLVYTFNTATFTQSFNAPLGNFNYTNYNPASAKYYRSKWWDNGVLVRSFIPVRDENNVGYMFDEVTGQLFGNAGSGSFGIGNDLPTAKVRFIQDVIPSAYLPLKYLESTGTQFILTGFTPTVNTDFELELSSTKSSTNWAMGCPTWVGVHYKGVDEQIGVTNSSTSDFQQYVNYARDNTRITMKLQGNTVYANGVSLGTITRRAGTLDFALFGYRDANRGATLLFTGSIYKCIIWDNGVPVRDLYPALRKSDNKPGMYDRITKQFFVNQGSGSDFNYEI